MVEKSGKSSKKYQLLKDYYMCSLFLYSIAFNFIVFIAHLYWAFSKAIVVIVALFYGLNKAD